MWLHLAQTWLCFGRLQACSFCRRPTRFWVCGAKTCPRGSLKIRDALRGATRCSRGSRPMESASEYGRHDDLGRDRDALSGGIYETLFICRYRLWEGLWECHHCVLTRRLLVQWWLGGTSDITALISKVRQGGASPPSPSPPSPSPPSPSPSPSSGCKGKSTGQFCVSKSQYELCPGGTLMPCAANTCCKQSTPTTIVCGFC